ncbi:MAG: CPBP family intramembrane metalloprotease [Clostridiales bacterium]|jgi:membrane protease YdiL (CAAX protease family)|nr:CPBP family intramembrane metalloprotease [Clostridiales bacterium]
MKLKSLSLGESSVTLIAAYLLSLIGSLVVMTGGALYELILEVPLSESAVYNALTLSVGQLFMLLGGVLYLGAFRKKNYFSTFRFVGNGGLSTKRVLLVPLISIGAILLFSPFADAFVYLFMLMGYTPTGGETFGVDTWQSILLMAAATVLIAPLVEETLFRGVFIGGAKHRGSLFAVLFSGLIFMLVHASPEQTVHQFFLGLILGYFAVTTGGIAYGLLLHACNNIIGLLFIIFPFDLTVTELAVMYAVWLVVGYLILALALPLFRRLGEREKAKRDNIPLPPALNLNETVKHDLIAPFLFLAKLFKGKRVFLKEFAAEFDAKYDLPESKEFVTELNATNAANENNTANTELPTLFGTNKNEKKLPASMLAILIGGAALWVINAVLNIFS